MSTAEPSGSGAQPLDPRRPPWGTFRKALEDLGFRPSRRLGQNFLLDDTLVAAIARDAGVGPGDLVVEVGPGCGFLSVHLAALGVRLVAVEVDPRLHEVASRFLAPWPDSEVLLCDVLAGKHRLAEALERRLEGEGELHLVSNLPYAVSAPVLALFAAREPAPADMTVLVQKEVGERLVAQAGSPDWGPLSLAVQLAYEGRILRTVGPGSFWPRPRVDSVVVRLERRPDRPPAQVRGRCLALARRVLTRRRQTLGRVLGDELGSRERAAGVLADLDVDPGRRAETLGREEWLALDAALAAGGTGSA